MTSLHEWVYEVVEHVILSADFNEAALRAEIDRLRAEIAAMANEYGEPAPRGAEAIQALLLEGFTLYDEALQSIASFLEDLDEDALRLAVYRAEEANDIFGSVESMIQTNKNLINEMIEA